MENKVQFPVLEGKIAERGMKKNAIAERLNITPKSFRLKMTGKTSFTWPEVVTMQRVFFPDMKLEELMTRREGA